MKTTQRGFTLVELLVVCGVIALGLALVTPAVQRSTAQARAAECKNNMKLLGLSLHNYAEVHGMFPPGWVSKTPLPRTGPRFGWMTMLLPYQEEVRLYNDIDFNKPMPPSGKVDHTKRTIKSFRCPSDTTADQNPMRGGYPTANYSGNFGSDPIPRWVPGRRSKNWPGQVRTPRNANGIFWCDSNARFRDILDGSTNTFMAGERSLTSGAGIWPGVGDNTYENDQVTDGSHLSQLNKSDRGFSSLHQRDGSGGAHFLMCDGAVLFISEKVESQPAGNEQLGTFQKLANRRDGMVVEDF